MIILLPRNREQPIGFKERRPDPSGTPSPDTPARIKKSLQAEATTCGDPGRVDCSGFIFMAVNSSVSQLSNAFLFAQTIADDDMTRWLLRAIRCRGERRIHGTLHKSHLRPVLPRH